MLKCLKSKFNFKGRKSETTSSNHTSRFSQNVHINDAISTTTRSKTSSTYSDYYSDYNTDIDLDISYKSKLLNSENEEDELFKLKNDFFVKYGNDLYKLALTKFHERLNMIDVLQFNEDIWKKCKELYEISLSEKRVFCIGFELAPRKHDFDDIYKLFSFFHKMHVKNIKIKFWFEAKNIILGFTGDGD